MDEPLSNLDAKQRVTMRAEIAQIHRQTGATTIYVTHDQIEAMTLADRIVIMKTGYVQQVGTPYELYFKPANLFVAGFIGEPPMNFIRRTVKNGCIMIGDTKLDISAKLGHLKDAYEGKDVHFGFRPEAIVLGEQENAYVLQATVELTEMLGDNTNVYVNIADANAILKVNPHDTPANDSDIVFSIPMDSVYLFDSETENVIDIEAETACAK
jgi:multiple sugar transport system ATP-binding protein